jgi:hypothetical protein
MPEPPSTRITRKVTPEDLSDLLRRPPRANIAFAHQGAPAAAPVAFRFWSGRYWVGLATQDVGPLPAAGAVVKLIVDDGHRYHELRGFWVRGRIAVALQPPEGAPTGLDWFELSPEKTVAWHYGRIRRRTSE